jgi:sulfur carrier protein
MIVRLNGQNREFNSPLSITELLEILEFTDKPVVVELDEIAIFPRNYETTFVLEGARLEIVALAAGG